MRTGSGAWRGGLAAVAALAPSLAFGQCPILDPVREVHHFGWEVVEYNEDPSSRSDFLISGLGDEPPVLLSGYNGDVWATFTPDDPLFGAGSTVCVLHRPDYFWAWDVAVVGDRFGESDAESGAVGVVRLHSIDFGGEQLDVFDGGQVHSWFGQAVAGHVLESVEPFLVIGAPGYGLTQLEEPEVDNRGAVFVYTIYGTMHEFEPLHIFLGVQQHEHFGEAVAYLDPLHEGVVGEPFPYGAVVAGAPRADGAAIDSGRVDVFDTYSGMLAYSLEGEEAFDWFGSSVSAAGDVDGDEYNDLIVGAPSHSSVADHAGRAYVFSGLDGARLYTWDGEGENDLFGSAVAAAGDVNGDGFADVLVGAPLHSSRYRNAGRVYLYSGEDGSLLTVMDGKAADAGFGKSLSNAWQYVASHRFAVGAPFEEEGDDDGAVYVLSDTPLLAGDIDQDGVVGQSDLGILLTTYELPPDDPAFNHLADVNGDGLVNQPDLGLLLSNYDKACSP